MLPTAGCNDFVIVANGFIIGVTNVAAIDAILKRSDQ